jgi:outer membrane protein assembly factor BamA
MDFQNQKPSASVKLVLITLLLHLMVFGWLHVSAQSDSQVPEASISSIEITGNKKTRRSIIHRELLFAEGDTILIQDLSKLVYQSRLNLLNTSLFSFVIIDTVVRNDSADVANVDIKISLLERFYIGLVPILKINDRNFNVWLQTRDITHINYGVGIKWRNFTGRRDELSAIIQLGENHKFSLAYQDPYVDKRKRFGLGFEVGYLNNREAGYITENDKLIHGSVSERFSTERYFSVNTTYRRSIFNTHQIVVGLHNYTFSDSLLLLNPDYSYPGIDEPLYINLKYLLKIDHRDIKYYPLKGWYADIEFNKAGLGFNFEDPVNVAWIKTTTRWYSQIASRWYTGISLIGKISSGAWQPYFLMRGLGYNRDYVRGYEYNVIDGKYFALARSNIKFALVPERTHDLRFIPASKFDRIHYAIYLTAFADAAYVWQPQWVGQNNNLLPQTMLAGTGLGTDLVLDYDKVIRIEFAINKSGESGIFIHFIAGI